jgi:predicted nuclease of predicted toxin-antitoxin system
VTAFLLDANLSPETSAFLRTAFRFDVVDLASLGLAHLEDPDVVEYARQTNRVIVTFDHDIPERYHRELPGQFGVILLRLEVQTVAAVNRVLERFFADPANASIPLERSIVVIDEARVRVTTEP